MHFSFIIHDLSALGVAPSAERSVLTFWSPRLETILLAVDSDPAFVSLAH